MTDTTICTGRNGTYCCTLPEGHDGKHMAVYRSSGTSRVATWTDSYSAVRSSDVIA